MILCVVNCLWQIGHWCWVWPHWSRVRWTRDPSRVWEARCGNWSAGCGGPPSWTSWTWTGNPAADRSSTCAGRSCWTFPALRSTVPTNSDWPHRSVRSDRRPHLWSCRNSDPSTGDTAFRDRCLQKFIPKKKKKLSLLSCS